MEKRWVVIGVLSARLLTTSNAYPTQLECDRELEVGGDYMEATAEADNSRFVFFERDGEELDCGSSYVPGETLVAKLSSIDGDVRFLMQVAGGTFSEQRSECEGSYFCDGARCAQSDSVTGEVTVVAPTSGEDIVLFAGFATQQGTVGITDSCTLALAGAEDPSTVMPTAVPTSSWSTAVPTPQLEEEEEDYPDEGDDDDMDDYVYDDESYVVARFPLDGGTAIDVISGVQCTTPNFTETDPARPDDPIEYTVENHPMAYPNWLNETDAATYFDGYDWFRCPSIFTSMISGSANRTVCVWAQIDAINDGGLFQYGDRATCEQFGLRTSTTQDDFEDALRIQNYGSCDVDAEFSNASLGEWAHYCVTYDGNVSALYVNWELAASAETPLDTGATSGGATSFFIGYNDLYWEPLESNFFVGAMSDLVIANKTLTIDEMIDVSGITDLMNDTMVNDTMVNDTMVNDTMVNDTWLYW